MAFVYSEYFYKGVREYHYHLSVLGEPTHKHHHSSHTKALPRLTLEEMNLYLTVVMQPLAAISIRLIFSMVSYIRSQVVHNRGHGFSKRFNPAGVYYFTHWYRPACLVSSLPGKAGKCTRLNLYLA